MWVAGKAGALEIFFRHVALCRAAYWCGSFLVVFFFVEVFGNAIHISFVIALKLFPVTLSLDYFREATLRKC